MSENAAGCTPDDPYEGRRQLDELTAAELRATRAWWFPGADLHLSGPDASTVLPVDTSGADEDGTVEFPEGRFLLHAVFTLADGRTLDGHVTYESGDGGTEADREPTVCIDTAQPPPTQIPFWHGVLRPSAADREAFLRRLPGEPTRVFPLAWRTTLHPPGEEIAGRLPGFAVLDGGEVRYL